MIRSATNVPVGLAEDLGLSERLSRMQGQEIGPTEVIRALQRAKARHVLVGAHAISAWAGDPRATIDVDIIASKPAQARKALEAAFPNLKVEDHPVVIRFKWEEKERIDIIKPRSAPIFRAALKHSTKLRLGKLEVDVPQLEMAIALKFAAMASPTRQTKDKYQDAHDFISMVQYNPSIDLEKLAQLGELVYLGGGGEIVKLVEDARAGRRLQF